MKHKLFIFLFIIFMFFDLNSITLVYNLKIRRAFSIPTALRENKDKKSLWLFTALPIFYKRDRHIVDLPIKLDVFDNRYTVGSLFNLRYISKKSWWLEFTTGLEHEKLKSKGTANFNTSRTGFDDIVVSGGYNFNINDRSQFVLFGLTGFPTRTKVVAQEAQDTLVGTRFFAAGIGSEISCSFIKNLKQAFTGIFQNRFLHFFDRSWSPILPAGSKVQPGNVTDLLFLFQYRHKFNIIELGYNPSFFTNQAVIVNCEKIKADSFIRHGLNFSISHICKRVLNLKRAVLIGAGFNIARSKQFDTKIFDIWLNISTLF